MQQTTIDGMQIQRSSDNVFADLALPDAENLKIKTGLVVEIRKAMRAIHLNQQQAAQRMGISLEQISAMMQGDFTRISEHTLMDCLSRLGYDIEIRLQPTTQAIGQLRLASVA